MVLRAVSFLLPLSAGLLIAGFQEADDHLEPSMIFALEIDGKKIPVELDKAIDVKTKSGDLKVTLRAEEHRVIAHGGMRFHYPRDMGFEANRETAGLRTWSLDGNNVVFILHKHLDNADHEEIRKQTVAALIRQYGAANTKSAPFSVTLEKKEAQGTKLTVRLAGSQFSQSVHVVPSGKDTLVMIFQDGLTDDGEHTAEFRRFLKMFEDSFRARDPKK